MVRTETTAVTPCRDRERRAKPGPLSEADVGKELWRVIRHLGDPFELDESRLTHLKEIEALARTGYQDATFGKGEALKEIISVCMDRIAKTEETGGLLSRCCRLLREIAGGSTLLEVSRELDLSREYVSREIRPRAIRMLVREFTAELQRQVLSCSHSRKA